MAFATKAGLRATISSSILASFSFFFKDTATTEIYTLSLHDALPISARNRGLGLRGRPRTGLQAVSDQSPPPRHRRGGGRAPGAGRVPARRRVGRARSAASADGGREGRPDVRLDHGRQHRRQGRPRPDHDRVRPDLSGLWLRRAQGLRNAPASGGDPAPGSQPHPSDLVGAVSRPLGKLELGRAGERAAAELLKRRGYEVVGAGFTARRGEIDLICRRGGELVIVEVKTRTSEDFGTPAEAVGQRKRRALAAAAAEYRLLAGWKGPIRYAVVALF